MIAPGLQTNISKLDLWRYRMALPLRLIRHRIVRQARAACARKGL